MSDVNETNPFLQDQQIQSHHLDEIKTEEPPESILYLKKGDSNQYINQFLANQEIPKEIQKPAIAVQPIKEEPSQYSDEQRHQSAADKNKITPSAFHNFQKHLTVTLKHTIQIPTEQKCNREYMVCAARIWKIFKNSSVSTKKILHYILGQRNQHVVTDQGLREFGLNKIYQSYDKSVINEAKRFLAKETLEQIHGQNFQRYIEERKIKDKDKFKNYIKIFIEELQVGFLKKRLTKEKVAELLA